MSTNDFLDSLIQDLKSIINPKKNYPIKTNVEQQAPKTQEKKTQKMELDSMSTEIKAPIHSTFFNLGDFQPGQYINEKHPNGHNGVDMMAPGGTPIFPMMAGIVTVVASNAVGGNVLYIEHPNGYKTYYAHCASVNAHVGDKVDIDTQIATVGDSGNAKGTAPHLHFQVWKNGRLLNPSTLFSIPRPKPVQKSYNYWMSDEEKQKAKSFDMKKHLATKASKIDKLIKISSAFEIAATYKK